MAVSLQIGLKQTQRLAMTQSLRQSIEMLQLSSIELSETISAELIENPVLEQEYNDNNLYSNEDAMVAEMNLQLSGDDSLYERKALQRLNSLDYSDSGYSHVIDDDDRKRKFLESAVSQEESLIEHLTSQISVLDVDKEMQSILMKISTSLDENGFFSYEKEKFLKDFNIKEEKFDKALSIIKGLEPFGVGASTSEEALLIQVKIIHPDNEILKNIVEKYFNELITLNFEVISKSLKITEEEVLNQCHLLQGLDPYPGRQFSSRSVTYVIPEIEVQYIDEKILITFINDWTPELRINPYYSKLLNNKKTSHDTKEYIRDKVRRANALMKNISNRRNTIEKTVRAIMEYQTAFLEKGPGFLRPLTHNEIAEKVELHESTISRVTTNKFIQTSWGVFELKYFFKSKIKSDNNEDHSSDEVKRLIKDIIMQEPSARPYSDEDIVDRLEKAGVKVARRTIAKYRGVLNIPSSSKRKRLNKIKEEGGL